MHDGCGVSVLVSGISKVGKSTLATTGPKPVLILDAEGSSRFLPGKKVIWEPNGPPPTYDGTWDICIAHIRKLTDITNIYSWLSSGRHSFKTIAIDSISECQQRAVDDIAGDNVFRIQDWGTLLRKTSLLIRSFRDLLVHPTNPVNIVMFIAMAKQDKQSGIWSPYLQGQSENLITFYCDIVGHLNVVQDDSGTSRRALLVSPHPQYNGVGDRTGSLPSVIYDPNLENMLEVICGATSNDE